LLRIQNQKEEDMKRLQSIMIRIKGVGNDML